MGINNGNWTSSNVANPHTDLMQIFYLNPLTTKTPQTILYDLFTTCGKGVLRVAQRNLSLCGNLKFSSESAEEKKNKTQGRQNSGKVKKEDKKSNN